MKTRQKEPYERRAKASRQEARVAGAIGGRTTPGSGNAGTPGDVINRRVLVECKRTDKKSRRISVEELTQLTEDARELGRTPVMALEFATDDGETPQDWALMPLAVALPLLRDK